jgi:serine/threonine protein kinase
MDTPFRDDSTPTAGPNLKSFHLQEDTKTQLGEEQDRTTHSAEFDLSAEKLGQASTATGEYRTGRVIGQYQLVEKVGSGGMGAVYRAVHLILSKEFALKILPPERASDARAIARFQREIRAIGKVDHPHIVRATDAGQDGGVLFLVMELLKGIDISGLIKAHGKVSPADGCEIIRQAALGLQCVHECGLIHRDIKPSNLLLTSDGCVKILDLGIARLVQASGVTEWSSGGHLVGTLDYMAPEQWEGSEEIDIRTDLYSLGCTLHATLVGRPPFAESHSVASKMMAHLRGDVPSLGPDVSPELDALYRRLMSKNPAGRPASPAEVAAELEPFCASARLAALVPERKNQPIPPDALFYVTAPALTPTGSAPARAPEEATLPSPKARNVIRRATALFALVGITVLASALLFVPRGDPATTPVDTAVPPVEPVRQEKSRTNVRKDDTARPGWRSLLSEQPTPRLWSPHLLAVLHHEPESELLRLDTRSESLIRLGDTDAAGYRLVIGFHQTQWTGGIGVYLGGRQGPAPGAFRYQTLCLEKVAGKANEFVLKRSLGRFETSPGRPTSRSSHAIATQMATTPDNAEQLLELHVGPLGLGSVRWNGQDCSELMSRAAREQSQGCDTHGEFGIYTTGCSAVISTGRILQTR